MSQPQPHRLRPSPFSSHDCLSSSPSSQALQVVPDIAKKVALTPAEEGGGGGAGTVAASGAERRTRHWNQGCLNGPYVLSPKDEDGHQKDSRPSGAGCAL